MESVLHAKNFVSPYYDSAFSGKYSLRILLKSNMASMAVIESDSDDLMALKYFQLHDTLEDENGRSLFKNRYFREISMLQKIYASVEILWFTNDFILLPSEIPLTENPESVWNKIRGLPDTSSSIVYSKCPPLSMNILYKMPKNAISMFKQLFENMHISHSASALLNSLQRMIPPVHKNTFALINGKLLEIVVLHNKSLLYYNSFDCTEMEDYLYYITWVYRELNLSASHNPLFLAGAISKSDQIYNLIKQYFSKLEFAHFKHKFNIPPNENLPQTHSLINLLY